MEAAFADAVFEGIGRRGSNSAKDSVFGPLIEYRFEVATRWKGDLPSRVSVWTSSNCAACGFSFTDGQSYLVYAGLREGLLTAFLCSRTISKERIPNQKRSAAMWRSRHHGEDDPAPPTFQEE